MLFYWGHSALGTVVSEIWVALKHQQLQNEVQSRFCKATLACILKVYMKTRDMRLAAFSSSVHVT